MEFAEVIPLLHGLGRNDIGAAITKERLDWMRTVIAQDKRIAELEGEVEGFCEKLRKSSQFEFQARRLLNPDLINMLDLMVTAKLGTGGGE